MQFGMLGPLEVRSGGSAVALGGAGERALLAVLLLHAREVLSTDRLVDELWGEHPPKTAVKTVQVYVSRLRKALGPATILTRPAGYVLDVADDQIDARRFEQLCEKGRQALAAGDGVAARRLFLDGLRLWRGAPLADFAYDSFAQAETARLQELRLAAIEDRVDADLLCGRSAELVPELQALAARHPLRERLGAQLMLALYRCGRQADALRVFRDARAALVEELGIEPGRELQDLHRAILNHDPELARPHEAQPAHGPSPFVGRSAELGALLTALARAERGGGGVILLSGEPGAGKTRLADELVGRAREQGFAVLRGRCWEAGGAPPFWPWVQLLRAHVRSADAQVLRHQIGQSASELAELLPELREVLGDVPRPAASDPETVRFRMFEAVAALLGAIARHEGPLLLVLDDLHASDEPSLLLLRFLATQATDGPMMVVGAHRDPADGSDSPLARVLGELAHATQVTRIRVEGLDRSDVATYLEAATARAAPARVVDAIHERTGGNPLFLVEVARLLELKPDADAATVATALPAGVKEAVGRRLERLPVAARDALAAAAVLGREFDPLVLELMAGPDAVEGIDRAIGAGIVAAAQGAPGTLRFSHSLVRDAVYAQLAASRRRSLHGAAAAALERRHARDPTSCLAAVAHQLAEARDPGATRHAARAATVAAARLAFEEAVRLYELALDSLSRHGSGGAAELCDILLGLGEARARSGDDDAARETFLRAAQAARHAGMPDLLGRAALGYGGRYVWTKGRGDPHLLALLEEALATLPPEDSALRARLLARIAAGPLVLQGNASRERRFALTAEAVAMARRLADPAVLAWALDGRKVAIWGPDTLEEQWAIMDELRELAERAGDPEQIVDAHVCTLIKLFERSELERFDLEFERARRIADELGQPGQRWLVAVHAPMHALMTGRLDGAKDLIDGAFELGRTSVPWNARTSRLMQRFVLCSLQGRAADVHDELRDAAVHEPHYPSVRAALASLCAEIDDPAGCRGALESAVPAGLDSLPFDDTWVLTVGLLADALAYVGDTQRAAIVYDRLTPYAHRTLVAPLEICLGTAMLALGTLASALGDITGAQSWWRRAAEENDRVGARPWAAHARRRHGELLGSRAGRSLLEHARTEYEALGMDVWAQRCTATLAGQLPVVCR